MNSGHIFRSYLLWSILASVIASFFFVQIYNIHLTKNQEVQFQKYANFLSNRVIERDRKDAIDFLSTMQKGSSFREISITEANGQTFVHILPPSLSTGDQYLRALHLIKTVSLHAIIRYKDKDIAYLDGVKYVNLSFIAFHFLLLSLLVCLAISYLFARKKGFTLPLIPFSRTRQSRYKREEYFTDFIDHLPEIVWEVDSDGHITYINQQGQKCFNAFTLKETALSSLFIQRQRKDIKQNFLLTLSGQTPKTNEYIAIAKDGRELPLFFRWHAHYKDGKIVGVRILAIDLSERFKFEKQLQRDKRVKELGMMAGGVAHDLNNILSGVVGYADLLLFEQKGRPREEALVKAIKKSGIKAAEVVEDLLMTVRGSSIIREKNDLIPIALDYFESADFNRLQNDYPHIRFGFHIEPLSALLLCSPIQIRKIFMNILINSAEAINSKGNSTESLNSKSNSAEAIGGKGNNTKHSQHQGNVDLHIKITYLDSPLRCLNGYLAQGEYICLSFQDNGPGIPATVKEKIFDPFYTSKKIGKSGTGLGMSLVWNAVEDHGGGILLEDYNPGTGVHIYLPTLTQKEASQKTETEDDSVQKEYIGAGQKILVVDDDPRQTKLALEILTRLRYRPKSVHSGAAALELLKQEKFDLLILDMLLGDGMDGDQIFAEACVIRPEQRAIIVSGYASRDDVQDALRMGAHSLLPKPYTIEDFSASIHYALAA